MLHSSLFSVCALALAVCASASSFSYHAHPCVIQGGGHLCARQGHDYTNMGVVVDRHGHGLVKDIKLTFALKHKNVDLLEKMLYDVSDPVSSNYGKHLTYQEVEELFHSPEAAVEVMNWVKKQSAAMGVKALVEKKGNFVVAHVPITAAEKMLNTKFYMFASKRAKRHVMRAMKYTLPESIATLIDFMPDVVNFPAIQPPRIRTLLNKAKATTGMVTPALLNSYYNIDDNNSKGTIQGLYESLDQFYEDSFMQAFLQSQNIKLNTSALISFAGDTQNNPSACDGGDSACGESMLDIEYMISLSQGAQTIFYELNDQSTFYDFLVSFTSSAPEAKVVSMSYGEPEDPSLTSMFGNFNNQAQILGVQGITIVVSSGDDGVNSQNARDGTSGCGFSPSFPATSPYVTAVGATQGPESGNAEIACSSSTGGGITSGGGFSSFPRPSYQSEAVAAYLKRTDVNLPPLNQFLSTGRGYPDVALLGFNYLVFADSFQNAESGTSASSPVFASMVALVNAARAAAGLSSVGFINPTLYNAAFYPSFVRDIVSGENNCAASYQTPVCCQYGFTAAPGWDPVTGLGSINFKAFKAAFLPSKTRKN